MYFTVVDIATLHPPSREKGCWLRSTLVFINPPVTKFPESEPSYSSIVCPIRYPLFVLLPLNYSVSNCYIAEPKLSQFHKQLRRNHHCSKHVSNEPSLTQYEHDMSLQLFRRVLPAFWLRSGCVLARHSGRCSKLAGAATRRRCCTYMCQC